MGAPKKEDRIDWDSQPLGEIDDAALAKKIGVTKSSVRRQRVRRGIPVAFAHKTEAIEWDKVKWGSASDRALSRELGVTWAAVARRRRERDMPVYIRIKWDAVELGKASDHDLSRKHGIDRATITEQRTRRGIGPYVRNYGMCLLCDEPIPPGVQRGHPKKYCGVRCSGMVAKTRNKYKLATVELAIAYAKVAKACGQPSVP